MSEPVVDTPCGPLVPRAGEGTGRSRTGNPVARYKNGAIKSIALESQTIVPTPLGPLPAEALTFYENGALKRVFPLNGKISGFWTEENERALTRELDVALPIGRVAKRFICFHFYPDGRVRSVTLWPGERVDVTTPCGRLSARVGIAFYASGAVRSLEPASEQPVRTPIGWMTAYDGSASGITGDENSLAFREDGTLVTLATCSCAVTVTAADGTRKTYTPVLRCDEPVPVRLSFTDGRVVFNERDGYDAATAKFDIRERVLPPSPCSA